MSQAADQMIRAQQEARLQRALNAARGRNHLPRYAMMLDLCDVQALHRALQAYAHVARLLNARDELAVANKLLVEASEVREMAIDDLLSFEP